ncbi:MAG: acyl carrier protein [Chloroflexi bacterium]|nr:acyl carrier protein [Chloroflexota bacterium]
MATREQIQAVVLSALIEINQQAPPHKHFAVSEQTALFGIGGALDSLGLVNLIVEIEQRLEDELGVALVLADERAMAQKNSPFRNVPALVDYVLARIQEQAHD